MAGRSRYWSMIMPKIKTAAILAGVCLAGTIALAVHAADPATQPGTDAAAPDPNAVMPATPNVLPNAPKVGDTAPSAEGTAAPKKTYVPQATAPGAAPVPAGEGGGTAEAVSPAAVAGSPDWPCVQRKVSSISAAQIWDGPSIEGLKVENDEKLQELTSY